MKEGPDTKRSKPKAKPQNETLMKEIGKKADAESLKFERRYQTDSEALKEVEGKLARKPKPEKG